MKNVPRQNLPDSDKTASEPTIHLSGGASEPTSFARSDLPAIIEIRKTRAGTFHIADCDEIFSAVSFQIRLKNSGILMLTKSRA